MNRKLLTIDAAINLLLGIMLVWYPTGIAEAMGLPAEGRPFFANILGAVLFGIGLALLTERFRPPLRAVGLGIGGAVAINLCGGLALAGWLLGGSRNLTTLGQGTLWGLVILLFGISAFELAAMFRRARD